MEHHAVKIGGSRQFIEVRAGAPLTVVSLATCLKDANGLATEHHLKAFLLDVRGFPTAMSPMETILAVEHLKISGLSLGPRIALLASPDDTSHDFLETAAQNRSLDLRCFKAEDAALAWLSA